MRPFIYFIASRRRAYNNNKDKTKSEYELYITFPTWLIEIQFSEAIIDTKTERGTKFWHVNSSKDISTVADTLKICILFQGRRPFCGGGKSRSLKKNASYYDKWNLKIA